jgi:hypothetical protein
MSRSLTNSAKNGGVVLTIKVPSSGRLGTSYVAVCAITPVNAVSDAEVDLFDAIFRHQLGERGWTDPSNDNCAPEGDSREQVVETPQV